MRTYCKFAGDCEGCDLAQEDGELDCQGNPIEFCKACHRVLGSNAEDCPTCWDEEFPDHCWSCGERKGTNDHCLDCRTHNQDMEDDRRLMQALGK